MVDPGRLAALLDRIGDELAALRLLADRSDLRDDDVALPAAKYRVIVALEAAVAALR